MIVRSITIILLLCALLDNSLAFAQAKASKAVKATETKGTKNAMFPVWEHGSLMLDSKTYEWINEAIKSHKQQIPIEILLPSLFPSTNQPIDYGADQRQGSEQSIIVERKPDAPPETPTFYLKSILYFGPENWSLWLNDKKASDKTNTISSNNVTVIDISRKQAVFLWEKSQIDVFYPNWKGKFTSMENGKYVSPEKNIIVDTDTGNISFILKPNQAFVSKTLEIVEGSIKVTKDVAPSTAAKAGSVATDKVSDTNTGSKSAIDPIEAIKNVNTIKSVLEQNVEKLR